ncbi:MAG: NADH-quinone oxidoreductase subunit D [Anaerolineae bacterium]|nr:NADH-quinone oxidoreductase subunit D [Anaerolineae bacterium]
MADKPVVEQTSTQLNPLDEAIALLQERFPDAVSVDEREGYGGVIVAGDKLLEVAQTIRDDLGFAYLSSATAVDYLGAGDHMEMVYHAYRVRQGGPALVFKAQTPRENASLPSLIDLWPGVDFQEREAWDLFGIRFEGHPNLKRILLWEGFNGHPMRKDWHEAYYEEDHKPYDSRWPGGNVHRAEENNPFGKNVRYPDDFTLEGFQPIAEAANYAGMGVGVSVEEMKSPGLRTDRLVVNLGPHHPSTHGVFRMVVTLDGETVEALEPVMGYLHRNHEKIGERNTWLHNMPFTDRLDYISSMSNNLGYALAVEQLMELGKRYTGPTRRAEVLRVLMVELTRIMHHLWGIGFLLNDLGAYFTPALYAIAEREIVLDFFEAVAGSRMMCNYMRFTGVFKDLPERIQGIPLLDNDVVRDEDTMDFLTNLIRERLPRAVDTLDEYLTTNEILMARCQGVGILPPEMAIAYSAAGPVLRASGVPYDVRRADPYSIYNELDFDVAVRYNGDIYDRYLVRLDEARQSLRILDQILYMLDDTKGQDIIGTTKQYSQRAPAGESYGRVENPKGELGYYVVSDGGQNPWRYHVRSPSFINLTAMGEMCKGHKVADIVAILGSIDIVLGEVDR